MTGPGYDVDSGELHAHAGKVTEVADKVSAANNAGAQVGLGGVEAYGLLCSPIMIPALQMFQGDLDELTKSASDLAQSLADGIKANVTDYQQLEEDLRATFDELGDTR